MIGSLSAFITYKLECFFVNANFIVLSHISRNMTLSNWPATINTEITAKQAEIQSLEKHIKELLGKQNDVYNNRMKADYAYDELHRLFEEQKHSEHHRTTGENKQLAHEVDCLFEDSQKLRREAEVHKSSIGELRGRIDFLRWEIEELQNLLTSDKTARRRLRQEEDDRKKDYELDKDWTYSDVDPRFLRSF